MPSRGGGVPDNSRPAADPPELPTPARHPARRTSGQPAPPRLNAGEGFLPTPNPRRFSAQPAPPGKVAPNDTLARARAIPCRIPRRARPAPLIRCARFDRGPSNRPAPPKGLLSPPLCSSPPTDQGDTAPRPVGQPHTPYPYI